MLHGSVPLSFRQYNALLEKIINIDGKELRCVANGATPRLYRGFFHKDIFAGIQSAASENGIKDSEFLENLAFVMAMQGGSISTGTKIEDWLGSMESPTAILEASSELLEVFVSNLTTTSNAKKK